MLNFGKIMGLLKKITQNTSVLYGLFFVTLLYFLSFLMQGNMLYASILVLIGFLTTFFSKNMVVVLGTTLAVTFLLRTSGVLRGILTVEGMCGGCGCGGAAAPNVQEGMDNKDASDNTGDVTYTTSEDGDESDKNGKGNGKGDDKKAAAKKPSDKKASGTPAPIKLELDNNAESAGSKLEINPKDTEHFKQKLMTDTEVSEYEKKSDRLILAQEKMLNSMNQYKPLLDTINSISKNMSMFKDPV
jgi:hypothetical protein